MFRISGLGFRFPGLGFRASDLSFLVAGLGFRDLEFGFRVSGVGCTAKSIRERAAGANEIIAAPTVAAWNAVCAAFGFRVMYT